MSLIFSDGEDLFLRIVASDAGLEIIASGPGGKREGLILEPKDLIGILSEVLNTSAEEA